MINLKGKKVLITGASGGIGGVSKKFISLNSSFRTNSENLKNLKKNLKK